MRATASRWYSVLLLRDHLGRFMRLRQPKPRPVRRLRRNTTQRGAFVCTQLALVTVSAAAWGLSD